MPEVTIFGQVLDGETYAEMASNFFEEASFSPQEHDWDFYSSDDTLRLVFDVEYKGATGLIAVDFQTAAYISGYWLQVCETSAEIAWIGQRGGHVDEDFEEALALQFVSSELPMMSWRLDVEN